MCRFLAGGLVELGMSWVQGVACVFLANALVLVPLVMIGHAGVKYGVSCGGSWMGWRRGAAVCRAMLCRCGQQPRNS